MANLICMEHLHAVDHSISRCGVPTTQRASWAAQVATRPAMRQVAAVVGIAVYLAAGWLLLTHVFSGREETLAPPQRIERPSTGVTITIYVVDGPSLYCATSADRIASDSILVAAREVPELLRDLGCWEPADN